MALDGTKTLHPSDIRIYLGDVGEAIPENINEPGGSWEEIGHTNLEEFIEFQTEGGETKTLGTAQNRSLRQVTTAAIRSFVVNIVEWKAETIKLYFGQNVSAKGDWLEVPEIPKPTEASLFFAVSDGDNAFCVHALKVGIINEGNISLADGDSFAKLPVRITALSHNGANPMAVKPL